MKFMSTASPQLEKRSVLLIAATLTAILAGGFVLLWWNRFLGGNAVDGNFFAAARLILEGKIPYRDFNLSVPPLEALKVAGLVRMFGDYLILPRAWGLMERVAVAALMCAWLSRLFGLAPAFLATASGVIVFCSAPSDPLASYNHSASFWAIAAGFSGSFLLESRAARPAWLWGSLCGACAGLCFLTKQTTGFGITVMVIAVLVLSVWRKAGFPGAVRLTLPYAAGWVVPVALVGGWLAANHALGDFLDLAFVHGPSSKGSLVSSLLRPLTMTLQDHWLRQEALVAALILIFCCLAPRFASPAARSLKDIAQIAIFFALSAGLVALAYAVAGNGVEQQFHRLSSVPRMFLLLSLFGGAATFLYYSWCWLRGQLGERDAQLWLISGISFTTAYMHSLSFVTTESMALPGAAFLLAWGLDRAGNGNLVSRWALPISALCLFAIFAGAEHKLSTPFSWYGWQDPPVNQPAEYSNVQQLRGIHMSRQAAVFAERLTAAVSAHSARQQPIYVFFYLPLGYVWPDRDPATFAYIHFIDVASDTLVESDIARLRSNPPAVIVYTTVPDAELVDWEQQFRGGKASGQRDLIATLNTLVASYKLVETLPMPGSERPVQIYARN